MKINRLIGITTLLLNHRTVTAASLAERFGVSTRTIYRDIDVLSGSGVPVVTTQGASGGISLMEEYTLSRTSLSEKESGHLLFALQTLKGAQYPEVDQVLDKLSALFRRAPTDWIHIEPSPWGAQPNEYHRFDNIQAAILQGRVLECDYISADNRKTHRKIAPLRLWFKGQTWYLFGFCYLRGEGRLFRLSRMKNTVITTETFSRETLLSQIGEQEAAPQKQGKPLIHLVLRFQSEALHRLYDDFDDDVLIPAADGSYTLSFDFPEDERVYGYILSFGPAVEVLSPPHIREIIAQKSKKIASFYV